MEGRKSTSTGSSGPAAAVPAGIAALAGAAALAAVDPALAALPLGLFLLVCLAAPFCPHLAWFGPVTSRGRADGGAVALTFDDGPWPETTPLLLDLLGRHSARATFFVTGRRVEEHPDLLIRILAEGHEVGNHTWSHDPLLALRAMRTVRQEISRCTALLAGLGVCARHFRPPAGIMNPRIAAACREQALSVVQFSRRANDFGNRRVAGMAGRLAPRIGPGDIVMLHDRPPARGEVPSWLRELESLLESLAGRGLRTVTVSGMLSGPEIN